jgi:hypothetical protein
MASRKKPIKKPPKKKVLPPEPALYLGCFNFERPGETDREGTFQMVVQASTPKQALDRFRARLRKLRTTTTLFDSPVTIYMEGVIALRGSFDDGLLVNWESGEAPPLPNVRLMCLIPEQDDTEAESYGIGPEEDGDVEPFLDFGGRTVARALAAARTQGAGSPDFAARALPHAMAPKMSAEERQRQRDEAQALKRQRAAEREAKKKQRVAAQEAKKRRASLVGETLAELGTTAKRPTARS